MIEAFIGSLSNAFCLIAIAVPFFLGIRGERLRWGVLAGWVLFVVALLFQDIISPILAYHYIGRDAGNRISPEQPGTIAAVFVGWLLGLLFHLAGSGVRLLFNAFKRRSKV